MGDRWKHWHLKEDSPEWRKMHTYDTEQDVWLTCSILPKIFGFDTDSAMKVYQYYKKERVPEVNPDEPALVYGHLHEPDALRQYFEGMPHMKGIKPGVVRHPELLWFGASLDTLALNTLTGELINVEVKCRYWGLLPVEEDVSPKWNCQIQGQMACIPEVKKTHLVIWKDFQYVVYEIEQDEKIQKQLATTLLSYKQLLEKDQPPPRGYFKKLGAEMFEKFGRRIICYSPDAVLHKLPKPTKSKEEPFVKRRKLQ